MDPGPFKFKIKMKRERSWEGNSVAHQSQNIMDPEQSGRGTYTLTSSVHTTPQNPIDLTADSPEHNGTETEDDQTSENANMQLVLYEPPETNSGEIVPAPVRSGQPPLRRHSFPGQTPRVLPAVGAFTVQCANCFKWRLIPTKEKYEEIREHILERPFLCETAREWRPSISCADEPDIEQDSSRLWAIDKPNIAQPPPGWQRLLRIRGEGSTKFADVYYESPTGKRLRSMVEIQKYLLDHPEYIEAGATMTQFSFQIPRPLQENYVRKRPVKPATFLEDGGSGTHGFDGTVEVPPLAWSGPNEDTDLRLGGPDLRAAYYGAHASELANEAAKRKKTPTKKRFDRQLLDGTSQVNVEDTLRL